MASFNRDNKRSGGGFNRGFGGGGKSFGGRNDGPKQMFPATCSKCGQSCEVPFKPTGERPVFCNNCFKSQGGAPKFAPKPFSGGGHAGGGNVVLGGGTVTRGQFDALNAKVDKILAILAPAKTEAPVALGEKKEKVKPKKKVAVKKTPAKKK